jgi:hypothetical protein
LVSVVRVRQYPFNPGYLTLFSAPKSRDLKIFPFKTDFLLIKGPFKAGFTVFSRSEERNSLRYVKYIGDGDSRAFKAIIE